ncbi:MAG: hypothetical protein LC797_03420 [Chloroflexi bacterium]|nr:hypothetical protein [Chloroflexota bacterium]
MAAVHQPTRAAPAQATRGAQHATWLGVLVLLGVLSVGRLFFTAFGYGIPAWFDEELNPLIGLITRGQPVSQIDPRQYGVVVFLVFDPALRVVGDNLAALATYATWVSVWHILYGSLMGFGYPLAMLAGGADTVTRWSTHFENNSLRGLIFKVGARFRLQGDTTTYIIDPALVPILNGLAYLLVAGLVGYLAWVAWRGRTRDSVARRSIEFSLAIVTMLLISPHTAQDYLVTVVPVLAVWLFLWVRRLPRPWSLGQTSLGVVSAVLIGVFVPMNLAARVLPIGWLLSVTGNAHNVLFVDQIGSAIGAYEFFGFPGIGLLLGWLLLVKLERASAT